MSKEAQKAKKQATRGASTSDPVQQAEQAMAKLDATTKQVLEWKHISKLESMPEYERCAAVLVALKEQINTAERERKAIVDPLNGVVKHVNQKVKLYTGPRQELEGHLKMLISGYMDEQRQKAIEAAEKQAKKAEKDGAKQLALDIRERAATSLPVTENPAVTFRKRMTFKVVDESRVPRGYLMVDDKAVNAAIAAGERKIAGLDIFEDTIVAVSA